MSTIDLQRLNAWMCMPGCRAFPHCITPLQLRSHCRLSPIMASPRCQPEAWSCTIDGPSRLHLLTSDPISGDMQLLAGLSPLLELATTPEDGVQYSSSPESANCRQRPPVLVRRQGSLTQGQRIRSFERHEQSEYDGMAADSQPSQTHPNVFTVMPDLRAVPSRV